MPITFVICAFHSGALKYVSDITFSIVLFKRLSTVAAPAMTVKPVQNSAFLLRISSKLLAYRWYVHR